jgi:hypothetical protein
LLTAELARRHGLSNRDIYDAYYVSLLRYLGCTAFSHGQRARRGDPAASAEHGLL